MPLYEHVFISRPDVSARQVEELVRLSGEVLAESGGKILKKEYWGLKTLAYKIKRNRKGHYSMLDIEAEHDAMSEMIRRLTLTGDVLRHITIRVDRHEAGESVQMRGKPPREEDGRGARRGAPVRRKREDGERVEANAEGDAE